MTIRSGGFPESMYGESDRDKEKHQSGNAGCNAYSGDNGVTTEEK